MSEIGFERKIGYSFVGLMAGNAVSFVLLLLMVVLPRMGIFAGLARVWNPGTKETPILFLFVWMVSVLGWAFVGLPVILLLRVRLVADFYWATVALIGTVLGMLAMLLFCLLLDRGFATLSNPAALRTIAPAFAPAGLIAGVAFAVYCSLIKNALLKRTKENGAPSGTPRSLAWFDF